MTSSRVVSISEVESIALRVFKQNFVSLAGSAADLAERRARAFTHALLSALANDDPRTLEKAADPAFLHSVYTCQRNYALTGDENLQDVLIQLVRSLASAKDRTLREISVAEAIDRTAKVTYGQLSILALVFVTTLVRWERYYHNRDFADFIGTAIEPFCCEDVIDPRNYSHLAALGCIEIPPASRQFDAFLTKHFRTLFSRGIPREEFLCAMDDAELYLPLFESLDGSADKLRFKFQTDQSIEEAAIALGLPGSWRSTLAIDARYLMTLPEKFAHAVSLHPAVEKLQNVWCAHGSLLSQAVLTTTGTALAHAFLASFGRSPAPLSDWL